MTGHDEIDAFPSSERLTTAHLHPLRIHSCTVPRPIPIPMIRHYDHNSSTGSRKTR
jgi:hypothetical protein